MKKIFAAMLVMLGAASAQAVEQSLGPGYKCELSDSLDNSDPKYAFYLFDMIFAPVGANPPGAGRVFLDNPLMFPTIPVIAGQAVLQSGFAGLSISVADAGFSGTLFNGERFFGTFGESHLSGICTWEVNLKRDLQP